VDGWVDGWMGLWVGWVGENLVFPNRAIRAALLQETRRNVSPTVGRVARR
jgi:hypothetical protein